MSIHWLRGRAEAHARSSGASAVLRLLRQGAIDQDSEGERRLARVLAAGGPAPHWGRWLLPGVRVDAVYPQARLVVEYDGFKHHSTSTDLDHDHRRRLSSKGPDGRS